MFFLASGAWQEQESPAAKRVLSDDDSLFSYYFTFVKLVISQISTFLDWHLCCAMKISTFGICDLIGVYFLTGA